MAEMREDPRFPGVLIHVSSYHVVAQHCEQAFRVSAAMQGPNGKLHK